MLRKLADVAAKSRNVVALCHEDICRKRHTQRFLRGPDLLVKQVCFSAQIFIAELCRTDQVAGGNGNDETIHRTLGTIVPDETQEGMPGRIIGRMTVG